MFHLAQQAQGLFLLTRFAAGIHCCYRRDAELFSTKETVKGSQRMQQKSQRKTTK